MTRKPSVPERLRRQVQERAQGRCEYCLVHEADRYYPHEADHVIAEKHSGPTSLDNLAWACFERITKNRDGREAAWEATRRTIEDVVVPFVRGTRQKLLPVGVL